MRLPWWAPVTRGASVIDAEQLARSLAGAAAPQVLDVRSRREYRWGHIPGAVPAPLPSLPRALHALGLDAGRTVVTVSAAGCRSVAAQRLLRERGFPVRHLSRGMRGWWENDYPTMPGSSPRLGDIAGTPLPLGTVGDLRGEAGYRRACEALIGVPATDGNRLDVLRNGDEIFPAMLAAIRGSTRTVDLLTYVYWTGAIADAFADALIDAASRGVRVRVLLDAVGAYRMDAALLERMRTAGVRAQHFRRPAIRLGSANHRTHRKVLVCDDTIGFTGGVGIAEEWTGDARNPSEWRDTHFRVQGPAVDGLRSAFLGNWIETGNALAEETERFAAHAEAGSVTLQVVRSQAAAGGHTDAEMVLRTLLRLSRRRLRISSAYFTPDRPFLRLLRDAAHRGVDVQVLIPGRYADKRVVQLAEHANYDRLLTAGVDIRRYQRTMLHTKIMTVDGCVAAVGSTNVNSRSLSKDDELCVVIHDAGVVRTLDAHFDEDLASSAQVHPRRWRRRGPLSRLAERAAGLLDPSM